MLVLAIVTAQIASPAALGPGGGAIVWSESVETTPYHLLAVSQRQKPDRGNCAHSFLTPDIQHLTPVMLLAVCFKGSEISRNLTKPIT